jgi:hypothetical protein
MWQHRDRGHGRPVPGTEARRTVSRLDFYASPPTSRTRYSAAVGLREVSEFGYGGLEVSGSSVRHYPGEQRVVRREVAQACYVRLDPGSHGL